MNNFFSVVIIASITILLSYAAASAHTAIEEDAQNGDDEKSSAGGGDCSSPAGYVALAVLLTVILTLLSQYFVYFACTVYRKNRHHVASSEDSLHREQVDLESGTTTAAYSYDNAAFKHELSLQDNDTRDDDTSAKSNKRTVVLRSQDFTGLGFDVHGNIREGIFIKDILQRGPAHDSKMLASGDRIKNVTVNFERIVLEDALAILSYASPYEVTLQVEDNHSSRFSMGHSRGIKDAHNFSLSVDSLKIESPRESTSSRISSSESALKKIGGVKVLPVVNLNTHPFNKIGTSTAELSQNDNNINLEKGVDVVDSDELPVEKDVPNIVAKDLNNSGIRRTKDGIPQEIPNFMLNAAVAARKNRRNHHSKSEDENRVAMMAVTKSPPPRKQKGKAPSPPPRKLTTIDNDNRALLHDSEVIVAVADNSSLSLSLDSEESIIEKPTVSEAVAATRHPQNDRKTVSTGNLTKIGGTSMATSNSLERAQSLDITADAAVVLPQLNLDLDSPCSDLMEAKKWGNLEDEVLALANDDDLSLPSIDDKTIVQSRSIEKLYEQKAKEMVLKQLHDWLSAEREHASSCDSFYDSTATHKRQQFRRSLRGRRSKSETAVHHRKSVPEVMTCDALKELEKIQLKAEQQLKKLPTLKYSTSTGDLSRTGVKRPVCVRSESSVSLRSRIPVARAKSPPTSPERRNSHHFDERDVTGRDNVVRIMSFSVNNGNAYGKSENKINFGSAMNNNSKHIE